MEVTEIVKKLNLKVLTAQEKLNGEVKDGHTSDLLSDVIAHATEKNIWITLQTHQNIIAVAKLKDLAGIIIVNDRKPDRETLQKAEEEKVLLLASKETAFTISGKLFGLIHSED
jgi:hypothetical protein